MAAGIGHGWPRTAERWEIGQPQAVARVQARTVVRVRAWASRDCLA